MKIAKKLSRAVIALAVCMLLAVTAWAANEIFVTYSATLDDSVLCVNQLGKTVTLTVEAQKTEGDIKMDSLTAQVTVPEKLKLSGVANTSLGFNENNYNINNGMILWYSSSAEDVTNNLLAKVDIEVPAGTPAGTYEITFLIIDISRQYGTSWEDGTEVTATLTVADHADGDDNDHLCDTCQGVVEGATCTYVPGEYVWSEDNNTCTVVGTCACTETVTAVAVATSTTTEGNCMTEQKTTYTATFTETWAENQTKEVIGDKDPNNHTGNNHVENKKEATVNEDGYTGDIYCECGVKIEDGKTIGKHQIKATPVKNFDKVPEAAGEVFESVEVMQNAMVTKVQTVYAEELAGKTVTTEFYDVDLTYYDVDSGEWLEADKEHFPTDGKLVVEIGVSDVAHHTYYVAHVLSTGDFGGNAGDIECPVVTKYTDPETGALYIRFTVTGLSPISVSYVRDDCAMVEDGYTYVDENSHTHDYKCEIPGCDLTDHVSEPHDFTKGDCICGAKKPADPVTGLKGDVNLDKVVDMNDVVALMRHTLKSEIITDEVALANGEVTNDDALDMNDVVKLMQYVLKAIDSLD